MLGEKADAQLDKLLSQLIVPTQKKSEDNVVLNFRDHRGNHKLQSFVKMLTDNSNAASVR